MNREVSIIIADDHPLLLKGLADYLIDKGYNVLASVQDGESALEAIQLHEPDVAVLDIEMPGLTGFELALKIKEKSLSTRVILLSYHKEASYTAKAKQLNIRAYLVKEDAINNIDFCIQQVMQGNLYFSNVIAQSDLSEEEEKLQALSRLTPSEKRILRLIANRKSTKELAEELFISVRTVEKHRSNISSKLDLSGKAHELLAWAIENQSLLG